MSGGGFIIPKSEWPEVFTVNDFNEVQRMVRETAEKFVLENLLTEVGVLNIETQNFDFTRIVFKSLGELGLLGIEIPEQYGGSGLDKVTSALVTEAMGKQGSFACTFGAHTGIGSWPIIFFGTEEQKQCYLPKLASGEWIAAYSLTEAGAGSDAASARAEAVLSADGQRYILNGEKIFVTNGGLADIYIVFAQLKGSGLTAFILEKNFPGLIVGQEERKMGIHGSSTTSLFLQDVAVPWANLLGEPGNGLKIALNVLNLGRFKLGAGCVGVAKFCLQEASNYARLRVQFGRPITSFAMIQEKLAGMAARISAMEAIVYRTAGLLEESVGGVFDQKDSRAILKVIEEYAMECSIVKVYCSEALDWIVDENVQIHGGSGFCEESPARHYRDSRINRIFEGTNEINRLVIMEMLGKKIYRRQLNVLDAAVEAKKAMSLPSGAPLILDSFDALLKILDLAKHSFLWVSGMAVNKFFLGLSQHQLVIKEISDGLIDLYVFDSLLGGLQKNGSEKNFCLAKLIFGETLPIFQRRMENILAICLPVENWAEEVTNLRRFLGVPLLNREELVGSIYDSF